MPSNGLLLRTDIRRLSDLGYVTVEPDGRFRSTAQAISHTGNICEDSEGRIPVECVRPAIGPNCWLKLDIEASE